MADRRRNARIDELAREAESAKRRGLSWEKLEARMGKKYPQARTHGLLRDAISQARNAVRARGARQAAQTRAQRAAARRQEQQWAEQARPRPGGAQPLHWQQRGGGALETDITRYDIRYHDPATGRNEHFSIFLPSIPGMSAAGTAARLAAAVAKAQGPFTTEEIARVYSLVLEAINRGEITEVELGRAS